MHDAQAKVIMSVARDSGCEADWRAIVPELMEGEPGSPEAREAEADVSIWAAAPWPIREHIDVIVGHPWAER